MADMLVNLLNLPQYHEDIDRLAENGITIRRVQPYEISILRRFIVEHFTESWADEVLLFRETLFPKRPYAQTQAVRN